MLQSILRVGHTTAVLTLLLLLSFLAAPALTTGQGMSFDGTLTLIVDDTHHFSIACIGGGVTINERPPFSEFLACDDVEVLMVQGTPEADFIALAAINASDFPNLVSITVDGGEGADQIVASERPDILRGGAGDDVFVGVARDDHVDGGRGQSHFIEQTEPLGSLSLQAERPSVQVLGDEVPLAPGLDTTIEGINFDEDATNSGFYHIPPDPIAAAGPNHVVSVVNTSIEWHTRAGTQQYSDQLEDFFAPLNPINDTFDPKVIYDQHANRFLVVTLERRDSPNSSRILLAVSDDSDPNGTWRQIAINSTIAIGAGTSWADYPGFAVDEEAVYITANMFAFGSGTFQGSLLWIVHKGVAGGFYAGGTATVTVHNPYATDGIATTTQPAHIYGSAPPAVGTFLVSYSGLSNGTTESIQVVRVDNPLTSPTFTRQLVTVGNIDNTAAAMPDAPQAGTTGLVETNDRRALNAVWRNNALWLATTLVPGSGTSSGQATAHWVQLNTSTLATIALTDQGDIGGEEIAPGTHTFFPSISADACGNVGIGFAASASSIYPGAYYTVRYATDPAGTVQPTGTLAAGLDYYVRTFGGPRNRWGDYSGTMLDPASEAAFWSFNEYALTRGTVIGGEDGRWGTRAGQYASGIDFGDLPAAYAITSFANDGARHCLGNLRLGALVDPDVASHESATSTGDDTTGVDDEDGVLAIGDWTNGLSGGTVRVIVSGSGTGCVNGWIDFNRNSDFLDPGEQVISNLTQSSGTTQNYLINVPAGTFIGSTPLTLNARFRLYGSCPATATLTGLASLGEVEDHQWTILPLAVMLESFDATPGDGSITITWTTVSELDTLGFNLLRATSDDITEAIRLNETMIPSAGSGSTGATYEWLDTTADAGVLYYYWLEAVATDGSLTHYGPVSAMIQEPTRIELATLGIARPLPTATVGVGFLLLGLIGFAWWHRRR